jgi:hypothetical protein
MRKYVEREVELAGLKVRTKGPWLLCPSCAKWRKCLVGVNDAKVRMACCVCAGRIDAAEMRRIREEHALRRQRWSEARRASL